MEDTLPYDDILDNRDRSWSFRLLERLTLPDISDDERGEIAWVLMKLEDPRCVRPLYNILTNTGYPAIVRETASRCLLWWGMKPDDPTLRLWWHSNDEILQLHALLSMGPEQADIIEQVAVDPQHHFYRNAIGAMTFGFELPRHVELKIKALSHVSPDVRETAADILLWDEPVRAEDALIAATFDPDAKVVEAACNTPQYYPTQKAFHRLAQLRTHESELIRDKAEDSYQVIRERFRWQLITSDKEVRKHIRHWLALIWDELAFSKKELKREKMKAKFPSQKAKRVTAKRVLKLLDEPNTSPLVLEGLFYRSDWHSIPGKKRAELTSAFLQHPDPIVRRGSAKVFSIWHDQDSLVKLLSDHEFVVRKHAMYELGETPPYSNKIARIAWKHLQRKDAVGQHGSETLVTYIKHAKWKKAVPHLIELALDAERPESLRETVIHFLSPFRDRKALAQLMKLIEDEPPLTWAIHVKLLEQARWIDIVPHNLAQLQKIDHLDIQVALAPFLGKHR